MNVTFARCPKLPGKIFFLLDSILLSGVDQKCLHNCTNFHKRIYVGKIKNKHVRIRKKWVGKASTVLLSDITASAKL